MPLWVCGDTHTEVVTILLANELDQIYSVSKATLSLLPLFAARLVCEIVRKQGANVRDAKEQMQTTEGRSKAGQSLLQCMPHRHMLQGR